MVTEIWTGRPNRIRGTPLDTTAKGWVSTPPKSSRTENCSHVGHLFAPSWAMVNQYKAGNIDKSEYTKLYTKRLRQLYRQNAEVFAIALLPPTITITCFCASDTFCHRHLLSRILAKAAPAHNINAILKGEVQ